MPGQTLTIEQLKLKDYKVLVQQPDGSSTQDVSSFVEEIGWTYDIDQPVETITLNLIKARDLFSTIKNGCRVYVLTWRPHVLMDLEFGLLRGGIVWDVELNTQNGTKVIITVHDVAIYLTSNKGSHIMQAGEKASDFIKRVAPKYGIKLDQVADTQIPFDYPLPFMNRSLYDMFATSLQNTRDLAFSSRTGADPQQFGPLKFYIQTRGFQIAVIEKKDPSYIWMFQSGTDQSNGNILSASNKFSLDNYKNVIKVYNSNVMGSDPGSVASTANVGVDNDPLILAAAPAESTWDSDPDIKQFGMLSESVDFTVYGEAEQAVPGLLDEAQYQADDLLRRLKKIWQSGTIETFNIPTIRAGDPIYVSEPSIGMVGKFYVKSGSHTVSTKSSTMVLTVNFEDFLPFTYRSRHENQTDSTDIAF